MKRGFTLIELLVVIAIIGLLSSVVLASLNSARTRAENAQRLGGIRQYQSALELYYSDFSRYPQVSAPTCLGDYPGTCWRGLFTESSALMTALAPYISSAAIPPLGLIYDGYLYINCPYSGVCTQDGYGIVWHMKGHNQSCGAGTTFEVGNTSSGTTYCILTR